MGSVAQFGAHADSGCSQPVVVVVVEVVELVVVVVVVVVEVVIVVEGVAAAADGLGIAKRGRSVVVARENGVARSGSKSWQVVAKSSKWYQVVSSGIKQGWQEVARSGEKRSVKQRQQTTTNNKQQQTTAANKRCVLVQWWY